MSKGFIKLHRTFIDWEWYDDHNATRLLLHLLLSVNYIDKKWKGILIKKGSMVLSWDTLSATSGMSKQQCRTAMKKLENSGEVNRVITNKFQVVELVKWEKLQQKSVDVTDKQQTSNIQVTDNQHSSNRQVTPTKETKNNKKEKKEKNDYVGWQKLAADSIFPIERLIRVYLADEKLTSAVISNKKNEFENITHLTKRMEEFKEHLEGNAVGLKTPKDFGSHFLRWHKKNKSETKKTQPYRNR